MTAPYAKLCKRVQNMELMDKILSIITDYPKITNKELALLTKTHRNTISKYRKIIRSHPIKTKEEIINKIDSKLEDRLPNMSDRDLISLRMAIDGAHQAPIIDNKIEVVVPWLDKYYSQTTTTNPTKDKTDSINTPPASES